MRSIFLALWACGAVSDDSSTCDPGPDADGNSLLQARSTVRMQRAQMTDAETMLATMQEVAKSFEEGAVATMTPADVNAAIGAANTALHALLPLLEEQHAVAQHEIEVALSAVEGCHRLYGGHVRSQLEEAVASELRTAEQCQESLHQAVDAEHEACEGQGEDPNCLCNEARTALTAQEALCDATTETYEAVYCEHHLLCTMHHDCQAREVEVYNALRADIEAAMAIRQQEYRTFMQSDCIMGLITAAMLSGTPIPAASLTACSDSNVDHLTINFPELPPAPTECLDAQHGHPQCDVLGGEQHDEWSLVMKSNGDPTLGFSSSYWTDFNLLNEDSPIAEPGNAKYAAFNDAAVTAIRICIGSPEDHCLEHTLANHYSSAHGLFSSGHIQDDTFDRDELLQTLDQTGNFKDCPMQQPGFNIVCPQNNKARFGFCNNIPSQPCGNGGDSDAAFGIGLSGQSSAEVGAGWTHYGVHPYGATPRNMWLWVKGGLRPPAAEAWNLVMKSNGDSTLGYSSSYWTDSALLNEQAPATEFGNAKYAAFNDAAVRRVRICIGNPEDHCLEHTLPDRYDSARSLFSAGYIADDTFDRDELLETLVQTGNFKDCPMQQPGFNIVCPQNNKARFGFCNNIPSQPCGNGGDSDAAFGIGLSGQSSAEVGAGWTHYGVEPYGATHRNMWLWVSE